MEIAEIFVGGRGVGFAVGRILAESIDVEGQQHRDRALADAGKALAGERIEAREGLRRRRGAGAVRLAAAASQSIRLSVTAGLCISPAAAGPVTSNARPTRTARFNSTSLARPAGPGIGRRVS